MGNQVKLGNGCVCDSDCESCNRLVEAWEAMREALKRYNAVNYGKPIDMTAMAMIIDRGVAALALADEAAKGKP